MITVYYIIMIDDSGQICIDFLMGITVFILIIGFTIQFIPGIFISNSVGDESLNYVAYHTACILVEDPGWWENNTHDGTNWEEHIENISRIGLASDDNINTRLTDTPNLLNKTKIMNMMQLNDDTIITKLGLFENVNGAHVDYGYNISLTQNGAPLLINNTPVIFGKIPRTSQSIFKIKRLVLVETGKIAAFDANDLRAEPPLPKSKTIINVIGPQNEDVIIQVTNFNVTGPNPKFQNAKLDGGGNLNIPSDYVSYKKTNSSDFFTYSDPLNSTDTLRLVFNSTLFPNATVYQLEFDFNQMNFTEPGPPYVEYTDEVEPLYEFANLRVEVWR